MKKELYVTLHDGTLLKKDLADFVSQMTTNTKVPASQRLPVGAPANHDIFKQLCAQVATTGIEKPDSGTKDYCCYVAPGFIKTVEVVFSNPLTIN